MFNIFNKNKSHINDSEINNNTVNEIEKNSDLDKTLKKYDILLYFIILATFLFNIYTYISTFGLNFSINSIFGGLLLILINIILVRFLIYKFINKKYRKHSVIVSMKNFFLLLVKQFLIIIVLGTGFVYYYNEISPATANIYNLTNNKQNIVFFEMAHIANNDFYKETNNLIKSYSDKGYILYFEGVDIDVSNDKVKDALGMIPTPRTYDAIGSVLGNDISAENIDTRLEHVKTAKNTDVKFSDLINTNKAEVKKSLDDNKPALIETKYMDFNKIKQKKADSKVRNTDLKDDEIVTAINKDKNSLFGLGKYIIRSFFNFSTKYPAFVSFIQSIVMPQNNAFFNDKALSLRNDNLAHQVISNNDKNIIITYGKQHFDGFFELLQKNDSNWKIAKTSSIEIFN